jgi:hypothetical protein
MNNAAIQLENARLRALVEEQAAALEGKREPGPMGDSGGGAG